MVIREARTHDLAAINDIYNHYVSNSTCTYQTEPSTLAERGEWFAEHDAEHPVTVTESAGDVVAWASLSRFRARAAYRFTVENTVYVRHDLHRRGLGRAMLLDLIERARVLGHHTIIAGVSAEQHSSIALHRSLGFEPTIQLREVGFKFDRWLDLVLMQRML